MPKNIKSENSYINRALIFIISLSILAVIGVISIAVAISEDRITLNTKSLDDYTLANEFFKNKEYSKAKAILEKEGYSSIDPKRQFDSLMLLGCVFNEIGCYDEALEIFNSLEKSPYAGVALKHNIGVSFLRKGVYDEAIENFENALSINPEYIPTLIELGNFYLERDFPRLAKGYYERIIKVEENDEATFNLGNIALKEGFKDVAYDLLTDLVKRSKSVFSDKAAKILGDIYITKGNEKSAVEMYLKSLLNDNIDMESVKRLVAIYEKNEDYDSVKKVYEQVIEKNSKDTESILELADIYMKEREFKKAVPYYKRLTEIKDNTNIYEATSLLANSYYQAGMIKESSEQYKKIYFSKRADDIYITSVERLADITYRQKYYSQSLRYYQEIFNTLTNNDIFMPRLGELELYYGNEERGLELLKTAINKDIGKAFPSRILAVYYESIGNMTEAINYYKITLQKYPEDRESIFRVGMLYYKIQEYEKAKEALSIASYDEKNTVFIRERALIILATMSEEVRSYQDAVFYYKNLIELKPSVESYILYAGYSYRRLNYNEAIASYRLALDIANNKNNLTEIYLGLAKSYFRLDDIALAEENYKKVLKYDRGNIQAQEGLKQIATKSIKP